METKTKSFEECQNEILKTWKGLFNHGREFNKAVAELYNSETAKERDELKKENEQLRKDNSEQVFKSIDDLKSLRIERDGLKELNAKLIKELKYCFRNLNPRQFLYNPTHLKNIESLLKEATQNKEI